MNNYKFTFETEQDYLNATKSGYIESFDIVRVVVKYPDNGTLDFPIKSNEELHNFVKSCDDEIIKIYQAEHSYDIADYYD
jgi:hypothetical protein